ncbi:hypothetical protein MRX96_021358 [Rhipicephalus microplus]
MLADDAAALRQLLLGGRDRRDVAGADETGVNVRGAVRPAIRGVGPNESCTQPGKRNPHAAEQGGRGCLTVDTYPFVRRPRFKRAQSRERSPQPLEKSAGAEGGWMKRAGENVEC